MSIKLAAALSVAAAAYVVARNQADAEAGVDSTLADTALDAADELTATVTQAMDGLLPVSWGLSMWNPDKVPAQYRDAIAQAENANGLPAGMLARLLWQESRYRPEIIDGRKTSSAGALGIAQFMPATAAEMGIDPLEPFQAIDAAGRYLNTLGKRYAGDWAKALAAYNWGMGNVSRKGLSAAPAETVDYYTSILNDIGMGGVYA